MSSIGIVGGSGMLGRAIAQAWLESDAVAPGDLWIANRSGTRGDLPAEVTVTDDPAALAGACDTILISIPPAGVPDLHLPAGDKLIFSVMAAVTIADLQRLTGSPRIIRAMSSPAAARRLAYSPWVAAPGASEDDRMVVRRLLSACGTEDALEDEAQLDHFTALTGPVPGFVAWFAAAMTEHAEAQGIPPEAADRAIRQLFRASGEMLAEDPPRAADHVRQMLDYAGTTAAGLQVLEDSPLRGDISKALSAAAQKARDMRP
ncbi:pyrroline-5-carboxylate reductase [Mameliella alba]|uniref:pyrroline-5-carboxylate reductase family protein n=1 Tax=Mameliella alba TaxID=561184 RepID=UPI000885A3B7|nr:pyrroline-5-carboxylate reductase dimerization domain-containing protein [Mameliella alba]OWV42792.1 pyrroline-5-carboxylate reductase [Mameliella alba]PTR35835.1 pyrroline-5-carboxylate reductase [Mameliella alba]GGF82066.1 pyrroline-5-carboxylate reductase [Mameliella alba]SDE09399.1 pyrroline-5-carboxylate reductase [Mameliella alba]